jgi:asparagine synthase (glutamine-hydrolysing)
MYSRNDRYVMVFNGEIYNHLQLRKQLESQLGDIQWNGHSDTETLLTCFDTWGIDKTLQQLVGMFAIALWDKQKQALTLVRDRVGEKPLYWGWIDKTFVFGSELKSLQAHPAFDAQINRDALALLLRYNYIPAPYCIYQDVNKLQPGCYFTIELGALDKAIEIKRYWSLSEVAEQGLANPLNTSADDAIDLLEQQLTASIGDQMLADVPLGAFLSGGVDSSTVVALMQKQSDRPVKTFSIGFNEPGYNEAEFAKQVSEYLGTEHTEFYAGAKEALDVVPQLASMYCEPFADSSQIPTFLVSKMAKEHVTVVLSGDGGDELFGGYNPYQFAPKVWNLISKFPVGLRAAACSMFSHFPLPDKVQKLLNVLPAKDRQAFYYMLNSHWKQPESLVIGANASSTVVNSPAEWPKVDCFEHWMMAVDAKQYMTDDILHKVDRAAMANSLETRIPMLDHRVIELAWRCPISLKIKDSVGKWLLREVLYRHVPREMIERPKKGFSIPLGQWLQGPLKDWAEQLLDENILKSQGFFNVVPIRKLWTEHLKGKRDNSLKLWSILMFQAWYEQHHT